MNTGIIPPMWGDFYDDWLNVAGLVLTIGGFMATLINVIRAKRAATRAQEAVDEVRGDILRIDMVTEFSSALKVMGEIKRLQRQKMWDFLPDRYTALRQSLNEVRGVDSDLPDHHKATLQSSIVTIRGIENQIEEALESRKDPPNVAKLNNTLSEQEDNLQAILTEIKTQIGA